MNDNRIPLRASREMMLNKWPLERRSEGRHAESSKETVNTRGVLMGGKRRMQITLS
jgi:hypothetical protein